MSLIGSIEQFFESQSPAIVNAIKPMVEEAANSLAATIEASLVAKFAALEEKLLGTASEPPAAPTPTTPVS